MAGIIARITRSNRERLEKKKAEISVSKCNYTLEPFDDHFDPLVRWIKTIKDIGIHSRYYLLFYLSRYTINTKEQN